MCLHGPIRPEAPAGAGVARSCPSVRLATSALIALIAALLLAAPADAATRRATDREAGIRFTLDGRVLTVRLLPSAPRRIRRTIRGRRIHAACGTNFLFSEGRRVGGTRLWRAGRTRLRYRFRRDISRGAKWCLLEHPAGGDVAFVSFA